MDKYSNKTGGRPKGTPNKKQKKLLRLCVYSPLEALFEYCTKINPN